MFKICRSKKAGWTAVFTWSKTKQCR